MFTINCYAHLLYNLSQSIHTHENKCVQLCLRVYNEELSPEVCQVQRIASVIPEEYSIILVYNSILLYINIIVCYYISIIFFSSQGTWEKCLVFLL